MTTEMKFDSVLCADGSEPLIFGDGNPTHAACGNEVTAQCDTQADEPFWHCYECDESFTIGGDPASHFTAIPAQAPAGRLG